MSGASLARSGPSAGGAAPKSCACVDIGGTYIKSGLLENGQIVGVRTTPTLAAEGGRAVLARVAEILKSYPGAQCAGVSTAGEVDAATGKILLSDNIPGYTSLAARDILMEATGLPTAVENDVNAQALGEAYFGAAKGERDFVMLSYGTGVGGAIVQGGKIFRGATGSAGEFGGLITHPGAVRPNDIQSGSYELYAGTAALVKSALAVDETLTDGKAIFAALERPEVAKVLNNWIDEVCHGLVGVVHSLNPALLVLGGGIMAQELVLEKITARLYPRLKSSFCSVRLAAAQLGDAAGLYGAGWLACKQEEA